MTQIDDRIADAVIVALANSIKKAQKTAARNSLEGGETYDIDATLRFNGSIKIGNDHNLTPTAKLLSKRFVAALIHGAGVTGPAMTAMIAEAVRLDILAQNDEAIAARLDAKAAEIAKAQNEVLQPHLNRLPKITSRGKVTTKLEVTSVA